MDLKCKDQGQKIILKKKAGLKLKKAPQFPDRVLTDALVTPSTNVRESRESNLLQGLVSPIDDEKTNQFNFFNCNSQKQLVTVKKVDPIEQIKRIISENERLRLTINQKQKIIDTRMKQRKEIPELLLSQRNSRSLLQPHEKQNTADDYGYFLDKQSISQNYKRSMLPQIESKQSSPITRDECAFTFANNFFIKEQKVSPKKINMMQAFPQLHLQRKFFT
ncbi:unnamed protein product [Paramecium primaurelia]|uniref:Uncharacterized protein n=3 Tax=Paramecium TaxID=5884 RepID=A0E7Q0_PARTE|nr:uncharacterized protein GSPATT00024045001 [Paramecium tetraurelia]CAD8076452.1 unnamed protein product [Paramecium primaurelia]CAD8178317.1 unnamed protein product [Paramecium pentaurelia]CAK91317.1 unnamed protein product [Paramecium tetraurelia]|eukprot:XP_001458714.1 hypothetical protein (macronuclear) [Paramecium tetraurelia strain d4-2]